MTAALALSRNIWTLTTTATEAECAARGGDRGEHRTHLPEKWVGEAPLDRLPHRGL